MLKQIMRGVKLGGIDRDHPLTKKERKVAKMMRLLRKAGYAIPENSYPNEDAYEELKAFMSEKGIS